MSYRQLDNRQIVVTIEALGRRIAAKFPDSGLSQVAVDLLAVSGDVSALSVYLKRPLWMVRIPVMLGVLLIFALVAGLAFIARPVPGVQAWTQVIQLVESTINDIVFLGVGIYFLFGVERRLKRHRALRVIHQLRSVAHVVDMHQLAKDPEQLFAPEAPAEPQAAADQASVEEALDMTVSAPPARRALGRGEFGRYLDYCSELLSMTSKLAAILVQDFDDPSVLSGVNEIEALTTSLSGKIWQKIRLLERA